LLRVGKLRGTTAESSIARLRGTPWDVRRQWQVFDFTASSYGPASDIDK